MPISSLPWQSFRDANGDSVGESTRSSGAPTRWSDLGRRAISASILAPVVLACIWFGGFAFDVLMLGAAVGLSLEWVTLCRTKPTAVPGLLVPAVMVLATAAACDGFAGTGLAILVAGAAIVGAMQRRVLMAAGLIGIGVGVVALVWLRHWDAAGGRWTVLFVVLTVWASDIGAYSAGRLLRGPKLAPSLSPAKTWSGAAGGLVIAMLVGQAVAGHVTLATAGVAALLAVACQAGDLLESGIKRHVGVKDSGNLIPGHGGLLDRLDGLLAAAPAAALVVLASGEGIFWH